MGAKIIKNIVALQINNSNDFREAESAADKNQIIIDTILYLHLPFIIKLSEAYEQKYRALY